MNEVLAELFDLYKHLRVMQEIVEEILTLDHYVYHYDESNAISLIDYCITKYDYEIRRIGSLHENKVVVDNDPHIYEKKDSVEINSDVAYIRDCLIIIGAVRSGIRPSIESVVNEMNGNK
jgi:hypothetical protein